MVGACLCRIRAELNFTSTAELTRLAISLGRGTRRTAPPSLTAALRTGLSTTVQYKAARPAQFGHCCHRVRWESAMFGTASLVC